MLARVAPGARVVAWPVASGVGAQPRSDAETRRGARQRAQRARRAAGADLGIGMEAGVAHSRRGTWTVNWCAVATADGRVGWGRGAGLLLPPVLAASLAAGVELGDAIEQVTGRAGVRRREGTIGVLTAGLLSRQALWEAALAAALAPLLHPGLYGRGAE